jgi:hypothetical protein
MSYEDPIDATGYDYEQWIRFAFDHPVAVSHDAKEGIIRAFLSGFRDLDSEMVQYAEKAIAGTVL